MDSLRNELKEVIVKSLRLEVSAGEIDDDAPLFGEGLELDSIDAIDLAIAVEKSFGVEIKDEGQARAAFQSVATLADFIEQHRESA